MTNTNDIPQSQPTDLVARFEPARAACRPPHCNEDGNCWVRNGWAGMNNALQVCMSCKGSPTLAGNEAKHMATLRRCMAAQSEVAP